MDAPPPAPSYPADYFDDITWIVKLQRTLNIQRGAEQAKDGGYPYRLTVTKPLFVKHIIGEITLAFQAVRHSRMVNFIGYDCDVLFLERLAIFKKILTKMKLAEATFAMTGSSEGRGKIIITLSRPMPRAQADELRDEITLKASLAGIDFADHLDVFPTNGEGGLVRILGRNSDPTRKALGVDVPLDLDGNFSTLDYLKPHRFKARAIPLPKPQIASWNQSILDRGIGINATHDEVVKIISDFARDAFRLGRYNEHEAWALYREWVSQVKRLSPDLSENKLRLLNPEDIECQRLFGYGEKKNDDCWKPFTLREGINNKPNAKCFFHLFSEPNLFQKTLNLMSAEPGSIGNPEGVEPSVTYATRNPDDHKYADFRSRLFSHAAGRLYIFLQNLIAANPGMNRLSFRITTERVGYYLGVGQPCAWRTIQKALKQGLLLQIEPGKKDEKDSPGYGATYCLVGVDDDLDELRSKARAHYEKQQMKLTTRAA